MTRYKEAGLLFTDGQPGRKLRMFCEKVLFCSESCPGVGRVSLSVDPSWGTTREPWKEASSVVHISGQHDSLNNILRDMMFSEKGETITGSSGKVLGSHYSDQQFSFWPLYHIQLRPSVYTFLVIYLCGTWILLTF